MLYEKIKPYLADTLQECLDKEGTKYRQICIAVAAALGKEAITPVQHAVLKGRVGEAIYPYYDLEDWLNQDYDRWKTVKDLSYAERVTQIQLYRHRWLKHLCEEYERDLSSNR